MNNESTLNNCNAIPATAEQFPIVASMLAAHLSELGVSRHYPFLPLYWQESCRFPFLIVSGNAIVGFALVRVPPDSATFELAEFYVLPETRRKGFGFCAVKALISSLPGLWQLSVSQSNAIGLRFWRAVLPSSVIETLSCKPGYQAFHFSTLACARL